MSKIPFIDVGSRSFQEKITRIGSECRARGSGQIVGVIIDNRPGLPEEYINAMKREFPDVGLNYRGDGPVKKTILLRFKLDHIQKVNATNE